MISFSDEISSKAIGRARLALGRVRGNGVHARLATNAFWAMVGSICSRLLTVLAGIVAARSLGADAFGRVGIIQGTVALFGMLAGLGFGLTSTKFVAQSRTTDPSSAGAYIRMVMGVTLASAALMAIPFVFWAPWLSATLFATSDIETPLRIGAVILIFGVIAGTQTGVLAGLEAFRAIAICSAIQGAISAAGLVFGALIAGLSGAIAGLAFGEVCKAAINYFAVREAAREAGIPVSGRVRLDHLRTVLGFSIPALLSSVGHLPAMWIANLLLVHQRDGYEQMGIFTAANRWSLAILFIPSAVSQIVLPMLVNLQSTGDKDDFQRVYRINLGVSLFATAIPSLVLVILSSRIMALYGQGYSQGSKVLVLLALSTVPTALNNVLGQVIVSAASMWWRALFDFILGGALLVCVVVAVPRSGASGLGFSYCIAYSVACAGLWIFLRRRLSNQLHA